MTIESLPEAARFAYWTEIGEPDDCWIWTGFLQSNGYGQTSRGRRTMSAHRFSYELHYGPIPSGQVVMHTCDVRACVNPRHLALGSHRDNTRDSLRKGRWPLGVRSNCAKLTEHDVRAIRSEVAAGASKRSVARRYGVARSTVQRVVNGTTWGHVA